MKIPFGSAVDIIERIILYKRKQRKENAEKIQELMHKVWQIRQRNHEIDKSLTYYKEELRKLKGDQPC